MKLTITSKLVCGLAVSCLVIAVLTGLCIQYTMYQSGLSEAEATAEDLINRSAQMFMVSTAAFDQAHESAATPAAKQAVLADWNRTIKAVDEAVINDFGADKPRARLIGDTSITGMKPFGGNATKIEIPFEREALQKQMDGEDLVRVVDEGVLRISIPLTSNMHRGCASCHSSDPDKRVVLGSLNAYIPLAGTVAEAKKEAWVITLVVLGFLGLLAVGIAVFQIQSIVRPIRKVTDGLFDTAMQVASASKQISQSSQQLASGASEQAASLEQTSAAMEELTSQSQGNAEHSQAASQAVAEVTQLSSHNAENAKRATGLAQETHAAATNGTQAMQEIAQAMAEIRQGSDKVSDIIEVIEEITHQTKMLATNAAIEAARAGDQGKGFAVVADEVAKLAESSKESAKQISALIRDSSRMAHTGNELSRKGIDALNDILAKVVEETKLIDEIAQGSSEQTAKLSEVDELVKGINGASVQQADGVTQITNTVGQMDQVTQQNAAGAEETASASEGLANQASLLRGYVDEIVHLVGSNRRPSESSPSAPSDPSSSFRRGHASSNGINGSHRFDPELLRPASK